MILKNFCSALRYIFTFILGLVLCSDTAFAQKTSTQDSTKFYKDLEEKASRSGFTRFFHNLIFIPVGKEGDKQKAYKKIQKKKPYSAFEGKIIRNINIESLDPFGYSITDTAHRPPDNFLVNAGNKLHIKTQKAAIRNLLLIRPYQVFDSLLVKESERLIRSQSYVRDVAFHVTLSSPGSDSVDIYIREADQWSIIPELSIIENGATIALIEQNFLGTGHKLGNAYTFYPSTGYSAYNVNYFIPNIRNTYINTTLHYGNDKFKNFRKSIAVDRPFFSPFAKWAAGVNFMQQYRTDSIKLSDSLSLFPNYKFNAQDYWAGSAVQLIKGNTENDRTTNFISALRFLRVRYKELPEFSRDTLGVFSDENFYLAGIGISTRKYREDKYIFSYGITENVPVGQVYGITGGYQEKHGTGRVYIGALAGLGNYYSWGYLSTHVEYGTFLRNYKPEQGVISGSIVYFTSLLEIGRWKFRQFVKPQFTIGLDRLVSDSITINEGYGIEGFNSTVLAGSDRLLLTLQAQSYAPWNLVGFRFGPYVTYSLGMLGNVETGFRKSRVYSLFGFGVLIKNLNLVFSTFQISVAYYPSIPGIGDNVFKLNPYSTTDFKFRDFDFGKPKTVAFQ